jgi:hypothetical protein
MIEFSLEKKFEEFEKAETEAQFATFGSKYDAIRERVDK